MKLRGRCEYRKGIDPTGRPRSYRKSVLQFCVSVLGRLNDVQYIFAVTSGSPSILYYNPGLDTVYRLPGHMFSLAGGQTSTGLQMVSYVRVLCYRRV